MEATAPLRAPPPRDLRELTSRARALDGRSLRELFREHGQQTVADGSLLRQKGRTGQLLERVLGATAGSASRPDFAELGVELKTVPVDVRGRPRESTFVCTLPLAAVDRMEWAGSPVRAKLAHVLFVPIVGSGAERTVGRPCFWRPSTEQEALLRADFEELLGLIALGRVESVTARLGQMLQLRPKAADGRVRTRAYDEDGAPIATTPRGFYLRARAVEALLREAHADAARGEWARSGTSTAGG